MWVNRPLYVSQLGLSSFRVRQMSSKLQLDVVTTVRSGAIWWTRTKAKARHGVVCRLNCVIHVWAPWGRNACHLGRYINPRIPLPLNRRGCFLWTRVYDARPRLHQGAWSKLRRRWRRARRQSDARLRRCMNRSISRHWSASRTSCERPRDLIWRRRWWTRYDSGSLSAGFAVKLLFCLWF